MPKPVGPSNGSVEHTNGASPVRAEPVAAGDVQADAQARPTPRAKAPATEPARVARRPRKRQAVPRAGRNRRPKPLIDDAPRRSGAERRTVDHGRAHARGTRGYRGSCGPVRESAPGAETRSDAYVRAIAAIDQLGDREVRTTTRVVAGFYERPRRALTEVLADRAPLRRNLELLNRTAHDVERAASNAAASSSDLATAVAEPRPRPGGRAGA